jgi:hypothetical protein
LAAPRALQHLEPITGRHAQVGRRSCLVQHAQLAQGERLDLQRQPPASPATPDARDLGVGEALNHVPMMPRYAL